MVSDEPYASSEVDTSQENSGQNAVQQVCSSAPDVTPDTGKADELRTFALRTERCVLEDFTPFSKSHLWALMMSFYDRQGVSSWSQGIVPHFITSNAFIAKRYSKLLQAYFRDACQPNAERPLDTSEPFYIVELGAGSGKFSFYLLQALAAVEDVLDFPLDQIRYVLTDFTAQNFNFWKTHPALAPFVKRGIVDFAIFDASKDTTMSLTIAEKELAVGQMKNPLCVVANYLFDTLSHDLFRIEHGELKQGLVSVGSRATHEPDPLDPAIISRLSNEYKYERIDEDFYGQDQPHLNSILKWYHEYFDPSTSATVLVPIGALSAIDRLSKLSNGRLLVLSGDKGNSDPSHFIGATDPHLAIHGSFSVMVNYHAIGIYFASRGGFAMHSAQEEASLKVSLFLLDSKDTSSEDVVGESVDTLFQSRRKEYKYVSQCFVDEVESFGPNDFFALQKSFKEETRSPSLRGVLSLLQLSGCDPDIFYKFRDVLLDHAPSASPKLKRDVQRCIPKVWMNYFSLDSEKDVAFELGRLLYGMHEFDDALTYYKLSEEEMGKHHVTSHNMGLCYYSKKDLSLAYSCFSDAHAQNASYQKALTWMVRVQHEMDEKVETSGQDVDK